ncbi:MAG: leucine-rich repeat domain-containing protein [Ruminococcus sp.]|nr:leucine-rich repeat domain-containing protein [Ruminococcus sp.]
MKILNKSVSIILTLLLILSVMITVPVTVSAATSTNAYGTWTYTVSNSQATITAYSGSASNVTIPNTLGGYPVVAIGDAAFSPNYLNGYGITTLYSITIPDSVITIGDYAFCYCNNLKNITMGNHVETIGQYAFYNCFYGDDYGTLTIPDSVTTIGYAAFYYCCYLTSVTIGSGITSIGDYAFGDCDSLSSVTINKASGTVTIGSDVFYDCDYVSNFTYTGSDVHELVTSLNKHIYYTSGSSDNVTITDQNNTSRSCNKYIFTATKAGEVTIYSTSSNDTYGYLFDNNGNLLKYSDDDGDGNNFKIQYTVAANTTYIVYSRPYNTSNSIDYYLYIEYPPNENGFTYSVSGSTATIIGYTGDGGNITVPSTVGGGKTVTAIAADVFKNNTSITGVTIPSSVTSVGNYAFYGCTNIASLTLNSGLTTIGDYAFQNCSKLTSVTIPNSVTTINQRAFGGCTKLETMTLGSGLTSLGSNAFTGSIISSLTFPANFTNFSNAALMGCNNLMNIYVDSNNQYYCSEDGIVYNKQKTSIARYPVGRTGSYTIPSNIVNISAYSFSGCQLSSIVIPDTVSTLGSNAFNGCNNLTDAVIGNGISTINSYAFNCCYYLQNLIIGSGVVTIGNYAFNSCNRNLTSVTIPPSVTSIGTDAFRYCSNLEKATFERNGSYTINSNAFANTKSTGITLYGYSGSYAKTYADNNSNATFALIQTYEYTIQYEQVTITKYHGTDSSVTIPSTIEEYPVKLIGASAFYNKTSVTSVTVPEGVTGIYDNAFNSCTNLSSITLPDGIGNIGKNAFYNTAYYNTGSNWSDGQKVLYIGNYLIKALPTLTFATIESGTTTIATSAFEGCTQMTGVIIPDSVINVGSDAFKDCNNVTYLQMNSEKYLPNIPKSSVTLLELRGTAVTYGLFSSCSELQSIYFIDEVSKIYAGAFSSCTKLTSVTLPSSVTLIDGGSFSGCTNLKDLTIEGSPMIYTAFGGCSKLENVTIKGGTIGGGAFSGLSSIKNLTLGEGVTLIDGGAFGGCSGITSLTIPSTMTSIGGGAFSGCTGLTTLTTKGTSTVFNGGSFSGCPNLETVTIAGGTMMASSFSGCSKLENVTIKGGVIEGSSFSNNTGITSLTLGNSVTSIGSSAFKGCTGLTSVTIPRGVTTIAGAFNGCTNLEAAYVLNRGTNMGDETTFKDCDNLVIYGYSGSTAETYADDNSISFTMITRLNTGSGYADNPFIGTMTRDSSDTSFGLSGVSSFGNIELLGVQKKAGDTNDMRFVAVVNEGIVSSAAEKNGDVVDYGFVAAKTQKTTTESATENYISKVELDAENTFSRSCLSTENTFCGDYGRNSVTTKYKYVTMAIEDVPADLGVVVRFYVVFRSGKVYYADYTTNNNTYSGCVTSYNGLSGSIA